MQHSKRVSLTLFAALFAIMALAGGKAHAQASYAPPNDELPNPYQAPQSFGQLPQGSEFTFFTGIDVDADGHIWIFERCPGGCAGKTVDTIREFDKSGKLLRSWGGGLFNQGHGLDVDDEGNIWLADIQVQDGRGSQVFKFTPDGKLLMTLGKAGVAGNGPGEFNQPSAVKIARNGDIFVASGHALPKCENSRIQKFSKDGKFIKEFGGKGLGPAEVKCPHQLAFDSKGRLFVAEMGSSHRVSIFDQEGKFITAWKQFGGATGVYIDDHDVLYATDALATDDFYMVDAAGWGYHPGVKRGVRIGSVTDGKVTGFIPDPNPPGPPHGREVVAVDHEGNLYQVPDTFNHEFRKYVKK